MSAPRVAGLVGTVLGLAMVMALSAPPAVADHLPAECWEGYFHRDDPECAFGPCVHHPPEAPADASCHPSCEGLRERVAQLEQDLRNLDERLAEIQAELNRLLGELLAAQEWLDVRRGEATAELKRLADAGLVGFGAVPLYWNTILEGYQRAAHHPDSVALFPPTSYDAVTAQWTDEHGSDVMRALGGMYVTDLLPRVREYQEKFRQVELLESEQFFLDEDRRYFLEVELEEARSALAICLAIEGS
ncbi:MAG: hypothetical protein HY907_17825 [Deltaproteobacteria bacterium]|nr:hypothetical protein [Deltaproteobacteria bacterium]